MNLIETVRNYIPANFSDVLSSKLGESSSGINKAVSALVPSVLSGFINRAESGDANGLLTDAKEAEGSGILSNPLEALTGSGSSLFSGGINRILGLFGGGTGVGNGLISAITNFSGVKSTTIQSLLGIVAPFVLGIIGKHAKDNNLSASSLGSFLSGQKNTVETALPGGFSLAGLFGPAKAATTRVVNAGKELAEEVPQKRGNGLLWLLLAIAAIALLWYFLRDGCKNDAAGTKDMPDTTAVVAPAPTPEPAMPSRASMKVKLANGTEIDALTGGVEDLLVKCIDDAGCVAGKETWFDFDNINFESGSSKLTAESQQQINNIAAILKAYPKAKIKIGGYTDKTGDAAVNKKLSQQRATIVMEAIKTSGGAAAQLIGAEGYGSEFAKVDAAASDEARKVDRRIAVQLREK